MQRLLHFLQAERKTLLGVTLLLALVAWAWLSNPAPQKPPPKPTTIAPGEHLQGVRIGLSAADLQASLGPPSAPPTPLPFGGQAWSYPDLGLQIDLRDDAVAAIRARVQASSLHTPDLAALGLIMDPSIPPHPNLTLPKVGKLTHDWRRLDSALLAAAVQPRLLAVTPQIIWRIYPGFIAVTTSDDPKQPPNLTEVIVSPSPLIPEVWASPKR
jgi:hypothetical protein